MRSSVGNALLLYVPLALSPAGAEPIQRHDGLRRVGKKPQVTEPAVLARRDDNVCGVSMRLCPSSLGGDCCPDNYECANESCYATTRAPSTCGTMVGWYACAAVYGGGCCPDGYLCQRAANCVPPSGSPYTHGCPSSHFLCPPSVGYGCCPDGMGCAVNQCYSTDPTTVTQTMVVTSTDRGVATVYTTTATTVGSPAPPTAFPTGGAGGGDQKVLKYFPSAVPKVTPPGGSGSGGGISAAQLGGIVAGSISSVGIALVAAFLLFRRFSARRRGGGGSSIGGSDSSEGRDDVKAGAQTKEGHAAGSDADAMSVVPLMMSSPRPSQPRPGPGIDSQTGPGRAEIVSATSFAGGSQSVGGTASRHTSTQHDGAGTTLSRLDSLLGLPQRSSEQESIVGHTLSCISRDSRPLYSLVRRRSDASSASGAPDTDAVRHPALVVELEARPFIAELPSLPAGVMEPRSVSRGVSRGASIGASMDGRRRSSASSGIWPSGSPPPPLHQRKRSDGLPATRLEEQMMHGYHGP
ncbi:Uncharacterized protein TCAP_04377 [Tolypocladium capitatum]|uniref:Uncharacterized protein n=1 Tax=Tolypocladium capitatum TaxID=45235 RepID=A0A2K3QDR6_9HYPO|nr:Uncharacterized protein TCAP_04377 [Tolypocladium capitatum]